MNEVDILQFICPKNDDTPKLKPAIKQTVII